MAQTIPPPTACTNETVHVVDDDPAVQKLFQQLGCIEGFTVTTYDTAGSFLEAVDGQRPGCAVVDLILPDRSGLDVLRELAARGSRMPVVFMSGLARATEAVSALKLGSLDFVEKPFATADMVAAIRRGLEADRALRQRTRNQVDLRARFAGLTPREHEVMQLVVDGLPNKAIAARLGVSPKTVEVHRAHVMQKTGADSLAELVKLAVAADVALPASGAGR
jgi:FixJ family two-component response regulator